MPSTLSSSLESLVTKFVDDILSTVRSGLDEAVFGEGREERAPRPTPKPTRARRRNQDVSGEMERIVAAVGRHEGGIRAEEVRKELGIEKRIFVRAVQRLLAGRQLRKTGEKRRTTYFVAGKRGPRPAAKTPAKASGPRRSGSAKTGTAKPPRAGVPVAANTPLIEAVSEAAKPAVDQALPATPSGAASEPQPAAAAGKRRTGRAGKRVGRARAKAATRRRSRS
jgi:hypothetical protein